MRMLPSKVVPFSFAIAFSWGRVKSIQKRVVWTQFFFLRRRKNRFKEDGFVWTEPYFGRNAKSVQALERKHNISDWRLENLACAKKKYGSLLDLTRLKEKSISIRLFIFNSDTFACVGLEKTFQQSDQTDLVTSHIKCMKCSVLCEQGCASRTKNSVFSGRKYNDEN